METAHVYLAGPLFSRAEQEFNQQLCNHLTAQSYRVFLPQKECQGKHGEDIYQTCLLGLRSAAVVVAILDGADADSGTGWECGYAVAQGIPVIAVRTDFRQSGDVKGFNAMLYYSASSIVESSASCFEAIVNALQSLVKNARER